GAAPARRPSSYVRASARPREQPTHGVFDAENAAVLAEADAQHWWFRSRATYVNWALGRFANRLGWLVDLGAGSGGVTARLAWDRRQVVAVEGNAERATRARDVHRIVTVQGDALQPPVRSGSAEV